MGTIQRILDGYTAFATENGTIHDNGTVVLLGGAVLIVLLALYAAYNVAAALLSGVRAVVVGAAHTVANVGGMIGRKPEIAVATAGLPLQRTLAVAEVGTGRPIARREVTKVG